MNYGLYLSASGVQANMYRQDVFTNNLANVMTPGFKVDVPAIRQRDPESIEDNMGRDSNRLLDQLGGGAFAGPQSINFDRARPEKGGALDVFLPEAKEFMKFRGPNNETRYSRDGRLAVNAERQLVNASSGHPILDSGNSPITVEGAGEVTISDRGAVMVGGEEVGVLGIVGITDVSKLIKEGQSMFKATDEQGLAVAVDEINLKPKMFEASGVNQFEAMVSMMRATKSVTTNGNMIRYHDHLMDRAINTLGRVQA